jgi:hypothetical protein
MAIYLVAKYFIVTINVTTERPLRNAYATTEEYILHFNTPNKSFPFSKYNTLNDLCMLPERNISF